jgi:Tfp pilus assembly protein PilN
MRAVNLLPGDDPRTRRRALPGPAVLLSAAAPLVAGGAVYLGYSHEHSTVTSKQAELAAVQHRITALTPALASTAAETGLVGERSSRQAALQDALSKAMPWDVTLTDLARVLPKQIWLTSLSANSPTPASAAAPTPATPSTSGPAAFTLQGIAHSQAQVADLLARLSLLPMLNDVSLASTATSTTTGGPTLVQFEVTAGLQQPPAKAVR